MCGDCLGGVATSDWTIVTCCVGAGAVTGFSTDEEEDEDIGDDNADGSPNVFCIKRFCCWSCWCCLCCIWTLYQNDMMVASTTTSLSSGIILGEEVDGNHDNLVRRRVDDTEKITLLPLLPFIPDQWVRLYLACWMGTCTVSSLSCFCCLGRYGTSSSNFFVMSVVLGARVILNFFIPWLDSWLTEISDNFIPTSSGKKTEQKLQTARWLQRRRHHRLLLQQHQ